MLGRHGWHPGLALAATALSLGAAAPVGAAGPEVTGVDQPSEVRVEGLFSLTISARDPDDAVNGVAVDFGEGEEYTAELACRRARSGAQPSRGPFAPGTPVAVEVPYAFVETGLRTVTVDVTSGACHGRPETTRRSILVVVQPRIVPPPLLMATVAGGCPDADLRPAAGRLGRVAEATMCLMNAERAATGARPLVKERHLRGAAITHSLDMVRRGYLAHEVNGGPRLSTRVIRAHYVSRRQVWTVGENIGVGTGRLSTPRKMVAGWMRSPVHRDNILNGRFRHAGVGPVVGVPGRNTRRGATYTVDFGRRS